MISSLIDTPFHFLVPNNLNTGYNFMEETYCASVFYYFIYNYSNFTHQKSSGSLEKQGNIRHLFDVLTTK